MSKEHQAMTRSELLKKLQTIDHIKDISLLDIELYILGVVLKDKFEGIDFSIEIQGNKVDRSQRHVFNFFAATDSHELYLGDFHVHPLVDNGFLIVDFTQSFYSNIFGCVGLRVWDSTGNNLGEFWKRLCEVLFHKLQMSEEAPLTASSFNEFFNSNIKEISRDVNLIKCILERIERK